MTTQVISTVIASWGPETEGGGEGRGGGREEGRGEWLEEIRLGGGERERRRRRRIGKVEGMITRLWFIMVTVWCQK